MEQEEGDMNMIEEEVYSKPGKGRQVVDDGNLFIEDFSDGDDDMEDVVAKSSSKSKKASKASLVNKNKRKPKIEYEYETENVMGNKTTNKMKTNKY